MEKTSIFHKIKIGNVTICTCLLLVEKIASLQVKEQQKHIQQLIDTVTAAEKGPPSQKKIHLLNYAASISSTTLVADHMVKMGAVNAFAKMAKEAQQPEM